MPVATKRRSIVEAATNGWNLKTMPVVSIDCETTGVDLHHGARPFLVTVCRYDGVEVHDPSFWEWDVDPITREVRAVSDDLLQIKWIIEQADIIVGQNFKFDAEALTLLFRDHGIPLDIPWNKLRDTLIAGHLLSSNTPHDLTSMVVQYLGEDISELEKRLKKIVSKIRNRVKKTNPDWCLASKENPKTPSVKGSAWANDMWIARAFALANDLPEDDDCWTVCSKYANNDSLTTMFLWLEMENCLKDRGLWKVFLERMKLSRIAMELEMPTFRGEIRAITLHEHSLEDMVRECTKESDELGESCVNMAESLGYELELPKSGCNGSLREFCFGPLDLPLLRGHKIGKSGDPSLDKNVLEAYAGSKKTGTKGILPDNSLALAFTSTLQSKRLVDTAITYLKGYKRYWQPLESGGNIIPGYFSLHGSANPTGTDTLRWSFSNPNSSNVSQKEDYNLRRAFGPAPGREWYSMDGQNLELRIPAYEAGEDDMIWIFEHPNDPPYFGSYHLLIFDLLFPDMFKRHGKKCKTLYEASWYRWVKSGNFAILYGCQEKKADETYRYQGAYKLIRKRFPKVAALADKQIALANKYGYVTTIPDKLVDPEQGYPICCTRTELGRVSPTVPLNYHIQSTAMQWTNSCMIECSELIRSWDFDMFMVMQVHDELDFDSIVIDSDNLWRIAALRSAMVSCGDRIGVPTPVTVERHSNNWSEGIDITKELEQLALAV